MSRKIDQQNYLGDRRSVYEYLQQHSDIGKLFDRTMADAIRYRVESALDAYDFSRFRKVVDIGGGNGALILEMIRRCQGLEGVVFDLPLVAERARRSIAAMPESVPCTVETGNALESVTEGADCYVMSNVLVSMVDAEAATILQNCRRAKAAECLAKDQDTLLAFYDFPARCDQQCQCRRNGQ
jgi:hypothetical protein